MQLNDSEFGRIDVQTVPVPDGMHDFFGTYTPSGRVRNFVYTFMTATMAYYTKSSSWES